MEERLSQSFIHPSAWKECSRKFGCRILHSPGPMPYAPPSRVGAIFHIIPPDVSYRIAAVLARLDHGYAMFYEVR